MKHIFSDNLSKLCIEKGLSSYGLSDLTGVSQRTCARLLNSDADERAPTIVSVEGVCLPMKIMPWKMFIPNIPTALMKSDDIDVIVEAFAGCSEEAKKKILQNVKDIARIDRLDREEQLT